MIRSLLLPTLIFICLGFHRSIPDRIRHDSHQTLLHFDASTYDVGAVFIADKSRPYFSFTNPNNFPVVISKITFNGTYYKSPYQPQPGSIDRTILPGQRDTIFFNRSTHRNDPEPGLYDLSWNVHFENSEHTQALNIFCEFKINTGHLTADTVHLPPIQYGEWIPVHTQVFNTGNDTVKLFHPTYFKDEITTVQTYPLSIAPNGNRHLLFYIKSDRFMNHYNSSIHIPTNEGAKNKSGLSIPFDGTLIAENRPSIRFDSTVLTLNTYKGGPGNFVFWFENDGDQPLLLVMVKTSCGCLVASYSREPVMPGERNKITVKYDTKRIGRINKSVTVTTNVEPQNTIVLRVKGNVSP